jgi:hypothetical protein
VPFVYCDLSVTLAYCPGIRDEEGYKRTQGN